jgi:hypothetical protein
LEAKQTSSVTNIIVSYFGDNKKIIEPIEKFMGKQFATMM